MVATITLLLILIFLMKQHMKLMVAGAMVATVLLAGATSTSAMGMMGNGADHDTLIQKIVSRFKLKQTDVQAVFNEARTERQAEMQKAHEARLAELVKTGKITEAQRKLIAAKHLEMQKTMTNDQAAWQKLTPAERQAKAQERRTAMQTWATQNGIDVRYLMMGNNEGGRGGRGMNQ